ncbi:MAG TPA: DUF4238 domain-containing protein [Candidatus Saccharimonadales bacterium]|nr:DUF4238 domain-containing protein [Candidatus Saccharimonadales bacterium]
MSESEPKKQTTKRQHWLPRTSYLQNFTVDGKVKTYWFGDKGRADFLHTADQKDIAPVNIAVKNNLYETPILPTNTLEDVLAVVEGAYGDVLENKIKQGKRLNEEDHEKIALYVSALENRTIKQQAHLNSFLDQLNETGRAVSLGHNAPDAADRWTEQMEAMKEVFFAQAMAIALEVNKWQPLDFCFLTPASYVDIEFITSDHPVTLTDFARDNSPFGLNQWSKTAECVVPLTPKIALFGNRCGITGYKEIDYNFVREINNRVLRRADKMLISANPIPEYEGKVIVDRMSQSLLLEFVKLPTNGRADKIIREQKKREQAEQAKKEEKP